MRSFPSLPGPYHLCLLCLAQAPLAMSTLPSLHWSLLGRRTQTEMTRLANWAGVWSRWHVGAPGRSSKGVKAGPGQGQPAPFGGSAPWVDKCPEGQGCFLGWGHHRIRHWALRTPSLCLDGLQGQLGEQVACPMSSTVTSHWVPIVSRHKLFVVWLLLTSPSLTAPPAAYSKFLDLSTPHLCEHTWDALTCFIHLQNSYPRLVSSLCESSPDLTHRQTCMSHLPLEHTSVRTSVMVHYNKLLTCWFLHKAKGVSWKGSMFYFCVECTNKVVSKCMLNQCIHECNRLFPLIYYLSPLSEW